MNDEELIEEITNRTKQGGDVSDFKKNRQVSPIVTLVSQLNSFPKNTVPRVEFMQVKDRILDRITLPQLTEEKTGWLGLGSLSTFLRFGSAILGTLLIVISLTLGTAVAALQSVPGQAIYPLKKIVENIQLKLTPENDKSNLQIQFANNRVDELAQVIQQQKDGQISAQDAQKIVTATVQDLQKTTAAAAKSSSQQSKAGIVNKLADLSNKLKIASVKSEGEVKIEIEKALQTTQDSKQEAIQNLVSAGVKIDQSPITADSVSAAGKLTAVSESSISIGTAKFLLTKDTSFINMKNSDLAAGLVVDIEGQIKDNKSYAQTVTLIADPKASTDKIPDSSPAPTDSPVSQ